MCIRKSWQRLQLEEELTLLYKTKEGWEQILKDPVRWYGESKEYIASRVKEKQDKIDYIESILN